MRDKANGANGNTVQDHLVQHPKHYNSHPTGVECIEIIQEFPFNIGTAIKHLWRAGLKPATPMLQDLRKALQYVQFEITRQEKIEASRLCVRCKAAPKANHPTLQLCEACMQPVISTDDELPTIRRCNCAKPACNQLFLQTMNCQPYSRSQPAQQKRGLLRTVWQRS